ncbi:hypothetical protein VNO77_33582 [Canavalia gladiata]|uniref:PAR1 protein n=1 Tax=Canavalia gladiata TaxID=3824 RepID=A0AAN9PWI1_CANGL
MAFNISLRCLVILAFAFFATLQGTLGRIECEELKEEMCAFAVSYEGKRCVLEKRVKRTGEEAYTCKSSEIEVENQKEHIESDECIKACGLNRKCFGISSDSLLESHFTQNLCSSQCYQNCPNIVDLYFNLAAGEGLFLPKLCNAQSGNVRREMAEIKSSGIVASGPIHSLQFLSLPPQSVQALQLPLQPAVAPALP